MCMAEAFYEKALLFGERRIDIVPVRLTPKPNPLQVPEQPRPEPEVAIVGSRPCTSDMAACTSSRP